MREKPITPYARLKEIVLRVIGRVKYPHQVEMWIYPKDRLKENWSLAELYERVAAADQLGYDVFLCVGKDGLRVIYRKRPDIEYLDRI